MNFYKRHLGDYAKDAGHLSMLEHGAYTLLLDRYYTTERPIQSLTEAYRVCRARSAPEKAAVDAVLAEFFTIDGEAFMNRRAEEEIAKASHQRTVNQELGKRGGRPKRTESETESVSETGTEHTTESKANSNPSQTPDTRIKEKPPKPPRGSVHEFPPGFESLWSEYPRKVGKDAAARAFAKRKPDAALLAAMVAAVKAQRDNEQWRKDGGQFIPHLSTWLNEGRWKDEQKPAVDSDLAELFARGNL